MIIWLSSYPRSGNTFFRLLLKQCFEKETYSIYNDSSDIGSDYSLKTLTGHSDLKFAINQQNFDLSELRKNEQIFFLKSHEKYPTLVAEEDKVIYIIRDGREATLSSIRYLKNFHNKSFSPIEMLTEIPFPSYGTWGQHVSNWTVIPKNKIKIIQFEKLIKNPQLFLKEISKFTGLKFFKDKIPSFEELNSKNKNFFSQGQINSWKTKLSDTEKDLFVLVNYKQLKLFKYETKLYSSNDTVIDKDIDKLSELFNKQYQIYNWVHKDYQNKLLAKQQEIQIKTHQIQEKQKVIQEKEHELIDKKIMSGQFESVINAKDSIIFEKQDRINELKEDIEQLINSKVNLENKILMFLLNYKQNQDQKLQIEQTTQGIENRFDQLSFHLDQKRQKYNDLKSRLDLIQNQHGEEKKKLVSQLENVSQTLQEQKEQLANKEKAIEEKKKLVSQLENVSQTLQEQKRLLVNKEKTVEEKSIQLTYKEQIIQEQNNELAKKQNYLQNKENSIVELQDNKWYRFGKHSIKRKVWVIVKIISKKFYLYWFLKLFAQMIKKIMNYD